jgi:molybdopterin-guanine dinucleotide biosynthesis protein A
MGRDKARVRIGGRAMLAMVRATAERLGKPVRVIRRDLVPRCGPLGGLLTGLLTTKAEAVLFLACDMPLITVSLLRAVVRESGAATRPVFAAGEHGPGFPLLLPRSAAALLERQIASGDWSLQSLAKELRARRVRVPARSRALFNVNAPEDLERVR